jgi:hypothetical protein
MASEIAKFDDGSKNSTMIFTLYIRFSVDSNGCQISGTNFWQLLIICQNGGVDKQMKYKIKKGKRKKTSLWRG